MIRHFDTMVAGAIASWPIGLKAFFLCMTVLGSPFVVVAIGGAVALYGYLASNFRLIWAGVTVWLTLGIGALIKLGIGRPRPATDYAADMRFQTFSFPSGHSSGAMVAYGLLAYLAWHLLPQPWNYVSVAVTIVIIILVGVSRVYLGAHYPSDVIAGWVLGLVALLIIIFVVRPLA